MIFFYLAENSPIMKKSILISFIGLMAIAVLQIASCSPHHPEGDGEYVIVSLSLAGEVIKDGKIVTEKGGDDLYGVNVFYDKEGDGTIDTPYGYGLFDNPDLMKVQLLSGYRYKFQYTIVRDGKSMLNNSYGGRSGRYGAPFFQEMENVFVYGKDTMSGLASGAASLVGERFYKSISPLDRFYGEVTGYEPSEGDVLELPVLRTSFGARFIINGINGIQITKFRGECSDFWQGETSANGTTFEYVCSFQHVQACWAYDGTYSQSLTVSGAFGRDRTYFIKRIDVPFKRNTMTTVNITGDWGSIAFFNITEEELPLQ